jgi:hypothetical protein
MLAHSGHPSADGALGSPALGTAAGAGRAANAAVNNTHLL